MTTKPQYLEIRQRISKQDVKEELTREPGNILNRMKMKARTSAVVGHTRCSGTLRGIWSIF